VQLIYRRSRPILGGQRRGRCGVATLATFGMKTCVRTQAEAGGTEYDIGRVLQSGTVVFHVNIASAAKPAIIAIFAWVPNLVMSAI